ncbi:MAG: AMP-binding protein [Chloroflexi bacterium]|nr:AMP-binding protein [Chloroflexota bacterium]
MQTSQPTPEVVKIRAELQRLIMEAFGSELATLPADVPILELGISSLALVEGMRRVYDRFGVLVSIRRVIEGQVTLGSLALHIEQELKNAQIQKKFENASLGEWKIERELELSTAQRHLAFLCHYSDEANAAFNEALVAQLSGALHAPALQAAVDEAGQRCEALRTAFSLDGESLQIGTGPALELQVNPVAPSQLDARLKEVVSAPFESGKRLFRAELLRLTENEHVLVLVGHALVLDQQALRLVLEDVARLYNLYRRDLPASAAPACLQWADYLALARTTPAQQAREQALVYWREQFPAKFPRLELPSDHPRPAIKKYDGVRLQIPLGARLEKKLAGSTQTEGALQAASTIYLQRLCQAGGAIIGVESSPLYPRNGLPALAATRNMLPLVLDYDAQRSFAHELASFETQRQAADEQRQLWLSEIIQVLNVSRDQSRSPLFSLALRSLDLTHAPVFDELQTELKLPPSAGARYDLELLIVYAPTGIQLACDGSLELFDYSTLQRWLNGICVLLEAALDDPTRACGLLPMLTPAEMDLVLKQWNHTEKALPDRTVYDLIREQAAQCASQTAVLFGENALTYAGLMQRSDQLAVRLHVSGVQAGERVGVLLRRSLDLLPAMLATWRLGAVYVPLDSTFPSQRLLYMLDESGASAILTTRDLLPLLGSQPDARALLIDEHDPEGDLPPGLPSARPGDGAMLLFTSGSTGKPKAVDVRQRALLNILQAVRGYIEFSARGRMLALTTSSFDISCTELFLPLMAGGLVEIAEDGLAADGLALSEKLLASRPTHVQATPSTWKALLNAGWQGEKDITLLTAGEALSRELAE